MHTYYQIVHNQESLYQIQIGSETIATNGK